MSKALLLSIKPRYVADILNGRKTIEIRKTVPKCKLPINVYIYCTKETQLVKYNNKYVSTDFFKGLECPPKTYNGKVVAKFTLKKVEEITNRYCKGLLIDSCLLNHELNEYLDNSTGYAWHISNLEIFDKPRELSEFSARYPKGDVDIGTNCKLHAMRYLTKAPQSYMFIEAGE